MLLFTPDKWAADNVAYMDMFPQCWSSLHTGSPSGSLSFFSCSMLLVLWINQWCWLISNILNRHSSCNILTCRGLSGNRSVGFWNLWVQSPNALIFDPHTSEASYGHADMGSVWSSTVQQWASPVCQSNAYSSLWNCCFEKSIGQQSPLYWPHHTIKWTMSGAALSGVLKWCEPGVGDFVSDEARCSAVNPLCRLIITTVCNVPNGTKWYKESLGDCWLSKYPSDPVDNSDRFWTFLFLDIQGSLSTIIPKKTDSLFDILYKLYRTKLNTKQVAMQLKQVMQKTFNNIKKKRLWV
jgi:hypothetical protein